MRRKIIALNIFLFVAIGALSFFVNGVEGEEAGQPDILIIYSSGIPFKTISEIKGKEVDAVTSPTPKLWNCRAIAGKLASILRSKGFVVRVAEVSEIKHYNEILHARLVVIGSPACFSNVNWQTKRLLDEQFSQIYVLEKKRLAKRRIAAFSMAEIDPSAHAALNAIKSVVSDCNGRYGPTMTFLTEHSNKEITKRISSFARQLELQINQ